MASNVALHITYTWIEAFIKKHHHPPTIFEIAEGLGISYQVARLRLIAMERQGAIYRDSRKRSIELRGIDKLDEV